MKQLLAILAFSTTALFSLNTQDIHATYLLAINGRENEAREVLAHSFQNESYDTHYISAQFLSWVLHHPSTTENGFNKASHFIVKNQRSEALEAILETFNDSSQEVVTFSESFVDWGLELLKIEKALSY